MICMRQRAAPLLLLLLACCSCSLPARAELQAEGPAAATPPAADTLLCPVSVQQMVTAAPETATQAVRDACASPTDKGFCRACICTMAAHFVPAALAAAGVLTNATSAQQRFALVDTCTANADLALLKLRALGYDSAESLMSQCDDNVRADLGVAGACAEFVPCEAVGAAAAPKKAAAKAAESHCSFTAADIASDELALVKQACANQTTSTSAFCLSCLCAQRSTVAAILGRHKQRLDSSSKAALANSSSSGVSAVAVDCGVEMMEAFMAGGVFGSHDALEALTGDTCRWFVKLSSPEQADTCRVKSSAGSSSSSSKWPTATAMLLVLLACLLA